LAWTPPQRESALHRSIATVKYLLVVIPQLTCARHQAAQFDCEVLPAHTRYAQVQAVEFDLARCSGRCPSYRALFQRSGQVTYEGGRWARLTGDHQGMLPPEVFDSVVVWSLELARVSDSIPPSIRVDSPRATLSIRAAGCGTTWGVSGSRSIAAFVDSVLAQVQWKGEGG
jgi:Domain of unknown function (DUF6438)